MDFRRRDSQPSNTGYSFDQASGKTSSPPNSHRSHSPDNAIGEISPPVLSKGFNLSSQSTSQYASRSSSALQLAKERESYKYFRSRRVNKGDIQQPWKNKKDPREKWVTIIPLIGIALGIAFSGFLIFDGLKTVVKHNYTLVFEDDFSKGFNTDIWTKESNVGGFG